MTDIDRHRAMGEPQDVIAPTDCEIREKALELALSYVKTGGATYVLEVAEQFHRFLTHTGPQDVISPR